MISSLIQDRKGFIWIGTENGLLRYDGYAFVRHTRDRERPGTIYNNHINALLEDSAGYLWIGTNHGVNRFDQERNLFTPIDIWPVKGGRNYITSFAEDSRRQIWVGTFGGVKRLNREELLLESMPPTSSAVLFNGARVLSLFFDQRLGMLVGTSTGLACFDPETGEHLGLPGAFYRDAGFLKAKVWSITKDSDGDLWFGTEANGLYCYLVAENRVLHYEQGVGGEAALPANWVYDILPMDGHTLWVATSNGLCILNKERQIIYTIRHNPYQGHTLSDNALSAFLKDRNGSVWIGTQTGGLNFYDPSNNNFLKIGERIQGSYGLTHPVVDAVLPDSAEVIWVGTRGGGLNRVDLHRQEVKSYLLNPRWENHAHNIVTALARPDAQTLLCGTEDGLFAFEVGRNRFREIDLGIEDSIVRKKKINALLVDGEDVWVGTDGCGLVRIRPDGSKTYFQASGTAYAVSDNYITDLRADATTVWIATQDGLNRYDKKLDMVTQVYKVGYEGAIANNNLNTLFIDASGRLWIGTDYGGLNYLDPTRETFVLLDHSRGLTNAPIRGITQDVQGALWVSSDAALFKVTPSSSHPLAGEEPTFEVTAFPMSKDLRVGQFSNNCAGRMADERMFFGATKGLFLFKPSYLFQAPGLAPIVLTRLKVLNQEVRVLGADSILKKDVPFVSSLNLAHDQNYLELSFSALDYVNPTQVKYAYKLESRTYADDWHIIGHQNQVNLMDLSPGDYVFQVKAIREGTTAESSITRLNLYIRPPWWRSWPAYLAYFLILAGLVFGGIRISRIRAELKRALLIEHLEKERERELHQMKMDFFTNISHEIRTPLSLMVVPLERLLELVEKGTRMERLLKTMRNNSHRLLKLVDELLDFRKVETGLVSLHWEKHDLISFCYEVFESFMELSTEKRIDYRFEVNSSTIMVAFDRHQMEKVLYNVLANAFKFTREGGKIVLSVEGSSLPSGWVHIRVLDNGIGIPLKDKSHVFKRFFQAEGQHVNYPSIGVGLALAKHIVDMHQGEIRLIDEPHPWATTIFQVALRTGEAHIHAAVGTPVEKGEKREALLATPFEGTPAESHPVSRPKVPSPLAWEYIGDSDPEKKTIFLVEDNVEFLDFMLEILSEEYEVKGFAGGQAALDAMEEEIPDLVVSDVMMPGLDGLELCRQIKERESTNHIPVILLTAKTSLDSEIEGLETGADCYITKPFNTKVLKLSIGNLLAAKEILRHKYSGNFIIDADLEQLSTPEEHFIKKLMGTIEANISNPGFSVEDLVREVGMSRTVLYKKVNALTNHSVATLVKHVRLRKAADILLNTSYSVSEVAFLVGFNDRKHFSREFKKFYDTTPSEYKRDHVPS